MTLPVCRPIKYALAAIFALLTSTAFAGSFAFNFAVIAPPVNAATAEPALRAAISETDKDNLAFVVVNGIRAQHESCDDALYTDRLNLLKSAKNGIVMSLAASDWSSCREVEGQLSPIERLNRLREMFFTGDFSLGDSRIPISRQSANLKFRTYSENVRWEMGDVMFATINLPANNNNYRFEAGRNAEFEDRLVANRDWLRRLFTYAEREKLSGIVLFSDGDPLTPVSSITARRDGFVETRQLIEKLAAKYHGRVLLIHSHTNKKTLPVTSIVWHKNIGNLDAGTGWIKVEVNPTRRTLFVLKTEVIRADKQP